MKYFCRLLKDLAILEISGILHRDIRVSNILIDETGRLKIIDLGFGKQIAGSATFDKSITLNWWCAVPEEFRDKRYDFSTEVYFVGKLFELLIQENNISSFRYNDVLRRMCAADPDMRISGFSNIAREIDSKQFVEIDFSDEQKEVYRSFTNSLVKQLTKVGVDAKYIEDPEVVESALVSIYKNVMLEEFVPDVSDVISCFVKPPYYFRRNPSIRTASLKAFVKLLQRSDLEQKRIILRSLQSRIAALPSYNNDDESDDDIPF